MGQQQRARHNVQNYKAVRRWDKLRRGEYPMDRRNFESVFTEDNPYPLTSGAIPVFSPQATGIPQGATASAAPLSLPENKDDVRELLKKIQADILKSISRLVLDPGVEQNLNAEAENESETQRQKETGAWGKGGNCLPSFQADVYHTVVTSYNISTSKRTGDLMSALSALGITLSPLLFPPDVNPSDDVMGPPPRLFRFTKDASIILSMPEYLATPDGASGRWRVGVYDRNGSLIRRTREQETSQPNKSDPKFILSRLLCGAHLDIREQLLLLKGYSTSGDLVKHLRTLVSCLRRNQFFHLSLGHPLDQFLRDNTSVGDVVRSIPTTDSVQFVDYLLQAEGPRVPVDVKKKLAEDPSLKALLAAIQAQ